MNSISDIIPILSNVDYIHETSTCLFLSSQFYNDKRLLEIFVNYFYNGKSKHTILQYHCYKGINIERIKSLLEVGGSCDLTYKKYTSINNNITYIMMKIIYYDYVY